MAYFCEVTDATLQAGGGVMVLWRLVDDTDNSVAMAGTEQFSRNIDETAAEMEPRIKAALTAKFNRVVASATAVGGAGERLRSRLVGFRVPPV